MEEAHDYRFGPVLEPDPAEQDVALAKMSDDPPVQEDIVTAAATPSPVKPQLRTEIRARRDALTERERNAATRRIVERLLAHPDLHRARTVLLYANYGSEVATDDLAKELLRRGKAVAYPKITAVAGLMTLWKIRNLDALIPHKHGIRAPDVTRSAPIEPLAIDCVIYPGIAFTRGLSRLGQGGGYYDRLSAKLADNCARIGICFETQVADSLPHEEHDAKVQWVVTEATVYPFVPDPPVIPAQALAGEQPATSPDATAATAAAGEGAQPNDGAAPAAVAADAPVDANPSPDSMP